MEHSTYIWTNDNAIIKYINWLSEMYFGRTIAPNSEVDLNELDDTPLQND